jgi:hypothetical protein
MGVRGRKSIAELSVLTPANPYRIRPPAGLRPAASAVFEQFIADCEDTHFAESDAPLLASLAEAIVLVRLAATKLEKDPKWLPVWERAVRSQGMLSTKLRLTPQSRGSGRADPGRALTYSDKVRRGLPWDPEL